MKLTGKAKEAFEEWYFNLPNSMGTNYGAKDITINRFYSLPQSMQWGIYQDWADSIRFELRVTVNHGSGWYEVLVNIPEYWNAYPTRQEARKAAIEKLNEIYNNQN